MTVDAAPPTSGLQGLADRLRSSFTEGFTRPVKWRREQVRALSDMLYNGAPTLSQAMADDLGKPLVEGWLTDIAAVRRDIDGIARNLGRWAEPRPVDVPWTVKPGQAELVPEPLGTALVIGPWNYPVRCTVLPMAFALAAGNTVALKPSELAPATGAALEQLIGEYLGDGPQVVAVARGGPDVAQALLEQRWDHIFFTGGGRVGRLVMAAAAQHLTPVTLELGGKNPAIVTRKADIRAAARRITWGKFLNAGQTCVAPDFALVDEKVAVPFLDALGTNVGKFFGEDPSTSTSFGRLVNQASVQRLLELLARSEGEVVVGGPAHVDQASRFVPPTIVSGVDWDDALMQEEIFGPVLPVLTYRSLDEAITELNRRDKPLALYVYTADKNEADRVIAATSSGSVCVNHNAVQLAVPGLPFGGVGASGMGAYHGQTGFDTFSHLKAVLRKPPQGELPLMYPPYSKSKEWALRQALR